MKFRIIAVTLFAVLSSAQAKAEIDASTIGGMKLACEVLIAKSPDSAKDFYLTGLCMGWVVSEMLTRKSVCFALEDNADIDFGRYASITARNFDGHSPIAAAQGFVNWANANPQRWTNDLMHVTWRLDLWAEFPCEAAN